MVVLFSKVREKHFLFFGTNNLLKGAIMDKRELAIELLITKAKERDRLPKRADFSDSDVCFIKQKLGPWPRALEAAGLKEPPAVSRIDKNREKRARAKQKRKEEKGK